MPQFRSLHLAIDLALAKREQALSEMQKQRQAHVFANNQMSQLQQYANETEKRWTTNAQISTTPELLHHHYQFMGRLQHAILLQQSVLAASEERVKAAQQQLLQAEFRIASLKQVLVKRQADIGKLMQRRDQKQMDEFASMQILRLAREKLEHDHER